MEAICGWYNPVTKEQGKFNRMGVPVRHNIFDKLINWLRKLLWDYHKEKFEESYYEYRGIMRWNSGGKSPLYVNPYKKKAYAYDEIGFKRFVDFNSLKDGLVIQILG